MQLVPECFQRGILKHSPGNHALWHHVVRRPDPGPHLRRIYHSGDRERHVLFDVHKKRNVLHVSYLAHAYPGILTTGRLHYGANPFQNTTS
jgi:hypothetical protein